MTGDPLQFGLLGLARFILLFAFGLAAGVVADRYDRRVTLITAQIALMAVAAAFAGLTATDRITLPLIYGLTVLSALFGVVSAPTRHALIPTLIPTPAMPSAMTMGVLTFQAAGMLVPAVGGALVASVGVAASYAVDAATFGVVALAAFALHTRAERQPTTIGGSAAAKESLRFLRDSPILLATMGLDFLANFFGASTTLMRIFAAEILGGEPRTLGWLLSAPAVGSVVGATHMASRRPLTRPGIGILVAIAAYGLGLVAFAFSRELAISLVALAASGAADAVSVSQRHTLRTLLTLDRQRGRVAAAHDTFAGGGSQLGEFEAGLVASWTSAPAAVALGGAGTIVAALAVWRFLPGPTRFHWNPEGGETGSETLAVRTPRPKSIDERGPGSI